MFNNSHKCIPTHDGTTLSLSQNIKSVLQLLVNVACEIHDSDYSAF